MNEKQQEFLDGLKKLPIAELTGYRTAGIFARRLVNISGIALALLVCYFPTGLNIAAGAIGLLYLAKTNTNINMSLTEINKLLQTRS
jgi:hypothetical protein